jgi:hypothetical protein
MYELELLHEFIKPTAGAQVFAAAPATSRLAKHLVSGWPSIFCHRACVVT